MTLGKPGVAGNGPDTFNGPSDVLVAPDGSIFVADGHGGETNARVVKFTKDGKFIKSWGKKGSGPGEFDAPHALAMDSPGRLFVGDRTNSRIQIFDQEGKYLTEWRSSAGRAGSTSTRTTSSMSPTQLEPDDQSGLQLGHPHRQREGRQGHRLHPGPRPRGEAYQYNRRYRGRCRGQPLRGRNQDEEPEEVRQEIVKPAPGNACPRTYTLTSEVYDFYDSTILQDSKDIEVTPGL